MQGLRTLCLGERTLGKEEYAEWDSRYQQSAGQIDGRDEAMAEAAEEVEKDLELIGCTAIEDKLQQGVASAIQTLLDAGIKVSGLQSSEEMGRLRQAPCRSTPCVLSSLLCSCCDNKGMP